MEEIHHLLLQNKLTSTGYILIGKFIALSSIKNTGNPKLNCWLGWIAVK